LIDCLLEVDAKGGDLIRTGDRFGKTKHKYNGRDEMRGSLRCAVHDETVNSYGRDDDVFVVWEKGDGNSRDKGNSRSPSGMTTRKTNATAKAKNVGLSAALFTMKL
jgi:hypothetical protein